VSCVPNQNITPCWAGLELEIENTGRNGNAIETGRLGPKIQQGRWSAKTWEIWR